MQIHTIDLAIIVAFVVNDIYKKFINPDAGPKKRVRWSRGSMQHWRSRCEELNTGDAPHRVMLQN